MISELKGAVQRLLREERTRAIGVYKLQDGDLEPETTPLGHLMSIANPHQRVAEFQVTEERVKPFGGWKPMSASEPVWLETNHE